MSTNTEIVAGAYDAMRSGNIKGFVGVLDQAITVTEPACLPFGGEYNGLQEVLGMFGQAGPVLDGGKMVVERVYGEGDQVTAVLSIPLRDGSGVASMVELWTLKDGKATELHVFWKDPTIVSAAAA